MPSTTNHHLQDLILALSKSEKRYFKISMPKDSPLINLFDLMKGKKSISDEEIKKKIKHGNKSGNISVLKNRLYNHILIILNNYHAEKSPYRQVKEKIQSIEILYKKGLYSQCIKIIIAAKKISETNRLYNSYLEISKWEKKIAVLSNYQEVKLAKVTNILEKDKEKIDKLQAYHIIWNVKSQILIRLYNKGKARSNADLDAYRAIFKGLPNKSKLSLDLETEYLYNHTLSAYYFAILDTKKSYKMVKENHDLVKKDNKYFSEEPNILLSILTNAIYLSKKIDRQSETDIFLSELETLYARSFKGRELQVRIFTDRSITKLASVAMNAEYKKGMKLIPKVEEGLALYASDINTTKLSGIYYSLAIINFGVGEFTKSLSWINKILNEVKIDEAEDQYCFAQILHLIIHIELSNDEYILHALKSLKRYLRIRNRMEDFETSFIKLISNLIKSNKSDDRQLLYREFADHMRILKINPFTQSAFDYFDFESWAISKINRDVA